MRNLPIVVLMMIFSGSVSAFARQPETAPEHALIYWRYLCRGQVQKESIVAGFREFSCPSQGWRVRTPVREGRVLEVLGHGG